MTEDINKLVDINLNLICEHKSRFYIYDFINLEGAALGRKMECEIFADEMEERGLIKRTNELCTVKEFGQEVYRSGGWLQYKFTKEEAESVRRMEQEVKENLDRDIKLLQKDSLEYQSKIRIQEDRIRDLDEQLKIINLIKSYWWLFGACIGIGMALGSILL